MNAEQAYLFRHAMLRDAAYQLQLPGDRARLHALAFDTIEALIGGPPAFSKFSHRPQPVDPFAAELVAHAELGASADSTLHGRSLHYIERAAVHAELQFASDVAITLFQRAAAYPDQSPARKCEVLIRAAMLQLRAGRSNDAKGLAEHIVELARQCGEVPVFVYALGVLATVEFSIGNIAQAEAKLREALSLTESDAGQIARGSILGNLSGLLMDSGRLGEAEPLMHEAILLHRKTGGNGQEAIARANLAHLYSRTDRFAEAEAEYQWSFPVIRALGMKAQESHMLYNYATMLKQQQRMAEAEVALRRSLELSRISGNRRAEGVALGILGTCIMDARPEEAAPLLAEACSIHEETGSRPYLGPCLLEYAQCLLALGKSSEARASWLAGIAVLKELSPEKVGPETQERRARCAQAGVEPLDI